MSKPENNGFVNFLHFLLFSWLIVLGHICVWLNVQQRMVEMIDGIASHLFYKNIIQNSLDTLVDYCAYLIDVKRYFHKTHNVNSPLLQLKIVGESLKDQTQLQFNRININVILSLAINMITRSALCSEDLTIFTFYRT